ncbi:MAG: hypothetical protein HY903_09150 [Deltaproteobacteria bacterium]|nr:hypothetical protein [Deltaproteobacteria bacterium]
MPIRDSVVDLKVTATTSKITGVAKPGAEIEAINVTTAPQGRLHLEDKTVDSVVVGKADASGKFSGSTDTRTGRARAGDQILVRAKYQDGSTSDWLKVQVGGKDTRNAVIANFRIEPSYDKATKKVIVVNNNEGRQISEPGAKLKFVNERTGKATVVTLNALGSFASPLKLDGVPGDVYTIAASDGVNNKDFAKVGGKLVVPKTDADTGDVDLPDPKLHKDDIRPDGTPKYQKLHFSGPVGSLKPEDVIQGNIGDCFFPAATAAFAYACIAAQQKPGDCVKKQADGTYVVTFKQRDSAGKVVNVNQHVDGDLWVRSSGEPLYGKSAGSADPKTMKLTWPLIEKAYASWMGSFNDIGNGGAAEDILEALTGRQGVAEDLSANQADHAWRLVKSAVDDKRPAVLSTFGESREAMYTNTGLYADHCYSILGCRTAANGDRLVKIRNPWGESEPAGDSKNDGIFEMKIQDVCRLYGTFHSVR